MCGAPSASFRVRLPPKPEHDLPASLALPEYDRYRIIAQRQRVDMRLEAVEGRQRDILDRLGRIEAELGLDPASTRVAQMAAQVAQQRAQKAEEEPAQEAEGKVEKKTLAQTITQLEQEIRELKAQMAQMAQMPQMAGSE